MHATRGMVAVGNRLIGKRELLRCPRSRKNDYRISLLKSEKEYGRCVMNTPNRCKPEDLPKTDEDFSSNALQKS